MSESDKKELFEYLSEPERRQAYLDSSIRQFLALKIKELRGARKLDQTELGLFAGGMKQSTISRLEDPRYSNVTLKTLKRLASAFDVALLVDLVSFSEFVTRIIDRTQQDFTPPAYDEERSLPLWEELVTDGERIEGRLPVERHDGRSR